MEFRAIDQLPLDFFSGFYIYGGSQSERQPDIESIGASLGSNNLHFDGVLYLHIVRL